MPLIQPRELSLKERRLLIWLLNHGAPEALSFLSQVDQVRVVGQCDCGCPTLDLALAGNTEPRCGGVLDLALFIGDSPEGVRAGVFLYAREGELSELEGVSFSEEKKFTFPAPESLKPFGPPKDTTL